MAPTLEDARARDKHAAWAALSEYRAAFDLPPGVIYLDGNSLGPLPRATRARMAQVMEAEWGSRLIRGWTECGWMEAPARIGDLIAPLVGAAAGEVLAADSTTLNLFKCAGAALALRPGRRRIVLAAGAFPTDRHAMEGLAALRPGLEIVAVPGEALAARCDAETALLLACDVHFTTGARADMAALAAAAHAAGALCLFDCSHSAGAVPVELGAAGADFAVGCGYKFLNGGPGAPAWLYVARRHQTDARSPLQGWMGHAAPFSFDDRYAPAAGIARFQAGTPGILGLAALEEGVRLHRAAHPASLWRKSASLFDLFAALTPALERLTPADPVCRGSHISFRHPRAAELMARLIAGGIIGDHRPPDVLRFGLTPLYTTHEEVWHAATAVNALAEEAGA